MLGINTVKNLALSFSLKKNYHNGEKSDFDYTAFWKNSLTAALTSKLLAQNIYPDAVENAFFVGLLHDIGILSIVQCMPKQYSLVLQEIAQTQCGFHEAETQILGFDHAEVWAVDQGGSLMAGPFCYVGSIPYEPSGFNYKIVPSHSQ